MDVLQHATLKLLWWGGRALAPIPHLRHAFFRACERRLRWRAAQPASFVRQPPA